jgi:uncharacterized membrane protein
MDTSNAPLGPHAADPIRSYDDLTGGLADKNIGSKERLASIGVGAALAAYGLSRRSLGGLAAAAIGGGLIYRGISGHSNVYQLLGIDRSDEPASPHEFFDRGIHIEVCEAIRREPWDLYRYWRNVENLPRIMSHLESVQAIDEKQSHWTAKAPSIAGGRVEWDAQIINDEPNALIAWRSLDADVDNAGSVRFVPSSDGTEVKVVIDYIPPAGRMGDFVARLFGEDPQSQIRDDLRRFKALMETGERVPEA